ncbi:DUF4251 domain-containing protein [Marinifilum sp. N1E240]|uniref:DUF4251 domain-containing protein n=1 Tax=Marinifilum sp. N1E240 TaxID=2608082 RepID=UPI00128E5214|nr:DUF4251 domain-containing protein [Marinifilum sp. N1E240]MPQ48415.1 DUF4251 domain-containing protein [Marinifilum sp. N1E240]|eukprot:TRINITY_DN575735_c0_g1_i1.p1 TRINITY_DN575735_c0_g1~~TRINITY_DN575735_c0_g1_i1.p1  ORF type:complete len:197 (+),score=35.25 TRINITY_DN575735_c0_g1_i1:78-668(+)
MKTILTTAIIIALGLTNFSTSFAQEKQLSKEEKKELRKEKKAKRKAERKLYEEARHKEAYQALKDLDFVLEAHTLYNKRGYSKNVSDNLNFISVKGKKAVVQLAFNNHNGINGLGGITVSGKISNEEYIEDKNGNLLLTFNVMGSVLNAEVRISLGSSNNDADANVDATTKSGKIKFRGKLLPTDKSTIYKSGIEY